VTGIATALEADAQAVGVALLASELDAIMTYAGLLARWNKAIRLVGPDDLQTIVREQVVDALGFIPALRASSAPSWLDIGAGGGLPGIVAAALLPERRFVLVEPTAKKTAFLSAAAAALELRNATIHQGRVTAKGGVQPLLPTAVGQPRAALSRATFAPPEWIALARPLVGQGGEVLIATATEDEMPTDILDDPATRRWAYRIPATGAPRLLYLAVVGDE